MTTIEMIDSVKQLFPSVGETQILLEIDRAQKKFCRRTKSLKKIGNLATLTSKAFWSVPSDFLELYEVELYDSAYAPLSKIDEDLDWYIDSGGASWASGAGVAETQLRFFSTNGTEISSIPTSISYILTRYANAPATLATRATDLDITDDDQTEGIFAGVLESFYARFPQPLGVDRSQNPVMGINTRLVKYWAAKARETEINTKKWINQLDSTFRRVTNFEHAGAITTPKEHTDATLVAAATSWT